MYIVGIDPSLTATALIALHDDGRTIHHRTTFGSAKLKGPARLQHLEESLQDALREVKAGRAIGPELVLVEGYSFGSFAGRERIGEWGGVLRLYLYSHGFRYAEVPPSTLKAFATGKGNSPKNVMLREVFRRWEFEAANDDEADAYALCRLGLEALTGTTKKAAELKAKLEVVEPA